MGSRITAWASHERGGGVVTDPAFCRFSNWQTIVSAGWENNVGTIANNFTFGRGSGDEELQEGRGKKASRQSVDERLE